jgi:membrane protease YdiL (CAAX protease family)
MPLVLTLLILAVSPGICEELFFRGAVLQSLRRDLPSWKIVLWQGLLFGLVHSSVFRFAPTAILGAFLAAVTLRARSLWPAMVLHAAYNASAHLLHQLSAAGLPEDWAPWLEEHGPTLAAATCAVGVFLLFRGTRTAGSRSL